MKQFFIILTLIFSFSSLAQQSFGLIEEEVYIQAPSESLVELIGNHPELTIDHRDKMGMELYGPTGMKQWLKEINVSFSENKTTHRHHKSLDLDNSNRYPTYSEIESFLKNIVAQNPTIAKLFSIGKSVEGRDLWVVKISDNVEVDEREPEFKYISSMHGNEITGRELTQFFIKDLIEGYGVDSTITDMIDNTEIYIMPSMNPDGSRKKQRANANGQDLNRNFPDFERGDSNTTADREPETISIMNFQKERHFSLSANFHGGAVCVNYPWDTTYDLHPLDSLVTDLSLAYADENPAMRSSRYFERGITNGAEWYVLKGGMQDWSYFWYDDLQVTIELSQKKWPRYKNIPGFYQDNKESMLKYMGLVHQGAGFYLGQEGTKGKVEITQLLSDGSSEDLGVFGFDRSEFYKVLETGNYQFEITVVGESNSRRFDVVVDDTINKNGNFFKAD